MEERRLYNPEDEVQDYSRLINDSNSEENDRSYSSLQEEALLFEEAIASTGIGNFHYLLLCVCGWALASDSVEIQVLYIIFCQSCRYVSKFSRNSLVFGFDNFFISIFQMQT